MDSRSTTDANTSRALPTGLREARLHAPARRLADAVAERNLKASLGLGETEIAFARYRLIRTLGSGGMGVVFEAEDPLLDRRVALKLLSLPAERAATLVLREARALGRLTHENVVHVFDVGEFEGLFFIAMEYVDGQNLHRWLEHDLPPWDQIVEVYLAAGRGLAAAHTAGIVHCDFKPANVLLANDGRILVVDFGIAAWLDDEDPLVAVGESYDSSDPSATSGWLIPATGTRTVFGTRGYIAPERLERGVVDPRGDQYGFCVALWESLFGNRPEQIVTGSNAQYERIVSKVPEPLATVLARGLASTPELRYPDMDALLDAIADARTGKLAGQRRRERFPGEAIAIGLAIAGTALGIGLGPPPPAHARPREPQPLVRREDKGDPAACVDLDNLIADVRASNVDALTIADKTTALMHFASLEDCPAKLMCPQMATLYKLAFDDARANLDHEERDWSPEHLDSVSQLHGKMALMTALLDAGCRDSSRGQLLAACLAPEAILFEDDLCATGQLEDQRCAFPGQMIRQSRLLWHHVSPDYPLPDVEASESPPLQSWDPGGDYEACGPVLERFEAQVFEQR